MKIFEEIARNNNTTIEQVKADIQLAVDATWNNPEGAEFRALLFPNGKPTPEEFIIALAKLVC